MSPSERRYPFLHSRQAALLAENNRLREAIRNGDWRNTGNELASIQQTIADNAQELDELEQVLAAKIDIPLNLVLMFALVLTIIVLVLLRV